VIPFRSVEESGGLHGAFAVNVDHQGSQSGASEHQALFQNGQSFVDVFLVGVLSFDEVYEINIWVRL